ncbi:Hypothetical predicted protein [Mytilus galloprovincialis]|uniref:Uncharacterized protein n=1 Tax=Mytilus galloprovincialis TaxID=29158 RepID=A0A8B6EK78_MYTGA|nr:Hypothetical predicted protein [Mytilus galloprovincialis]VDI35283.1 Hypothetical predicted protein [Mytilus galloprovincialis]
MQGVAGEGVTILSAKKKLIAIAKDEIIMFLKAYEANPCSWTHIIAEMMVNVTGLNQDLQDLYRRYTVKQLKLRLSTKLGKLVATPLEKIADEEVRNQIRKIKELELRLTVPKTVNKDVDPRETVAVGDNGPTQNAAHNSENEQQPT